MRNPQRWRARASLLLLVIAAGLLSSGCYLRLLQITVGFTPGGYPSYEADYTVSSGASSLVADCDDEEREEAFIVLVGCWYIISDNNGRLHEITSSFELVSELGVFGLLVDPVVLQVPQSIRVGGATVSSGPAPTPLVVTETGSFKAGPNTIVTAEQGMKFVILELPQGVAEGIDASDPRDGQPLDFQLTLNSSSLNYPVKTMFTVRIDAPGGNYYLPTLPCTTDFSTVPAAMLGFGSQQSAEQDARELAEAYAGMGCDGQVYDLRATPGPGTGEHRVFVVAVAAD